MHHVLDVDKSIDCLHSLLKIKEGGLNTIVCSKVQVMRADSSLQLDMLLQSVWFLL